MSTSIFDSHDKEAVRCAMKKMRSEISPPEAYAAGGQILQRILALLEQLEQPEQLEQLEQKEKLEPNALPEHLEYTPRPEPAVIGLYAPIQMEADLLSHADLLRGKGLQAAFPRVCGDTLVFALAEGPCDFLPGAFGIREPRPGNKAVLREQLFAICVPGLAFDRTGARIGYGKGYYDRFLSAPAFGGRPILIGTGYDFQLLDTVPQDPHDQRLDYIVTPKQTVRAALRPLSAPSAHHPRTILG